MAQIDVKGRALLFSTFLGGSGWEGGYGIAVDSMGGIYVAGGTDSIDFPVKKALQKNKRKESDAFITKLIME